MPGEPPIGHATYRPRLLVGRGALAETCNRNNTCLVGIGPVRGAGSVVAGEKPAWVYDLPHSVALVSATRSLTTRALASASLTQLLLAYYASL